MYDASRVSAEYKNGVEGFLVAAAAHKSNTQSQYMCCPCVDCENKKQFSTTKQIHSHLVPRGFMPGYTRWTEHGEAEIVQEGQYIGREDEDMCTDMPVDEYADMPHAGDTLADDDLEEMLADTDVDDLEQMLRDGEGNYTNEREFLKFQRMVEDFKTPLFPGCEKEHTKLRTVLSLLQLKASNGWSDKSFTELLLFLKKLLPKENVLPESTYRAKRVVCPLGLEVQKIHACTNDCMLYRGEHADLQACLVCGAARYKRDGDDIDGEGKKKRLPVKVMWYFPIVPRLERLFANKRHAELMRWHAEERKDDGMLRHPADSTQWRNIDRKYKKPFAEDVRNIRFGLSTDGMNPFGNMSSSHSTWPVTLCIYNLPPWLCMKRKYIMMPVVIPGPKQPGNDIDVYLKPLMEDLVILWNDGVQVWDAYKRENFTLRAMLFVTIQDWPALGNLSGQTVKGYNACVHCFDETESLWLTNSKKMVYLGYRKFLRKGHPYRSNKRAFDGKVETGSPPKHRTGRQVYEMVKGLRVILGKGRGSTPAPKSNQKAPVFKKKSVFYDLEYWPDLVVRHAIDVMHIEKNVCDSLIGTLLDIPGKTKDTLQARKDLKCLKLRQDLHPEDMEEGGTYLGPASYSLSKAEKIAMCKCLHGIKVPSGYSANIKRLVNMKDLKLTGMKSHDCHVMMTQMLPIAIRGILPPKVRNPIIKLCSFFNAISQKAIDPTKLDKLQEDAVETLSQLEALFPPSFFDIMVHLIVHIVKEIRILGPVFLHQMYPFERFMGVLKKYVRNRNRPEGCMVEGWGTEEVIDFCVDYMNLKSIGVPVSRHEGRLQGKGTIGAKSIRTDDPVSFKQAQFAVLGQSRVVDPYLKEHQKMLRTGNPGKSDVWIAREHREHFGTWLRRQVMEKQVECAQLNVLAHGPSTTILTFQGYDINGYTFYTRAQDNKSANQNSGVRIDAYDCNEKRETYYGFIEEIWELDYGVLKVPLFRCQWVRLPGGVKIDKYGMTTVDQKLVGYREEPFVLANDVMQVFYVKDPVPANKEERHVVLQGKRRIVGVEDVVDEEDYNQFDALPPFGEDVDLGAMEDSDELPYVRRDHNEGRIVKTK